MPFDNLPTTDAVMLNLMRGRAAIERGWCKGEFRKRGRVCILGAIGFMGTEKDTLGAPEVRLLYAALPLGGLFPDSEFRAAALVGFNDHYATKRDVLALYDRAIELAKAGGGV